MSTITRIPIVQNGILVICALAIVLPVMGCGYSGPMVRDAVVVPGNGVLVSTVVDGKSHVVKYIDGKVEQARGLGVLHEKTISIIRPLDGNTIALVTEDDGIYVYFGDTGDYMHMPVKKGFLASESIRDVYYTKYDDSRVLYVVYAAAVGAGFTECRTTDGFRTVKCKTFTKMNSELKSDFVHQVEKDTRDNLWVRYAAHRLSGVSRISNDGRWDHFTKYNSEVGDNSVSLLKTEKHGEGLEGDYVWFVSKAGISSLQYVQEENEDGKVTYREKWKLYGEKQTVVNKLVRAIGVQSWFTDAITDVSDIVITSNSVVFIGQQALFRFDGNDINRFIPEDAGGLDDIRIHKVIRRGDHFVVLMAAHHDPAKTIRSVMIFKSPDRTWHRLKYWDFAKTYPDKMSFLPVGKGKDIVIMMYKNTNPVFAELNYEKITLVPVEVNLNPIVENDR